MSIIDKAWVLQHRIEARLHRLPILSLKSYLKFCTMLFFIMGISLFLYLILYGINITNLKWFNDPLLFLGLGGICGICFVLHRYFGFFNRLNFKD